MPVYDYRCLKGKKAFSVTNHGKPPALPGDSQSLTVPGVCSSSGSTAGSYRRLGTLRCAHQ